MFDKFYTTNHKNPTGKKGLGLGLNLCKLVAEGHQGRIWAETTDNGLRIVLALPVTEAARAS
jgi:K+-sensing histidine kinase KdpD